MMKKIIYGLGMSCSLFLLSACQQTAGTNSNQDQSQEQVTINSSEEQIDTKSLYQTKVLDYKSFIESDTVYPDLNSLVPNYVKNYKTDVYYTYLDLDNNGIEELLFAFSSNASDYRLIDLYTVARESQEVLRLTNEDNNLSMLGERMNLQAMSDGSFVYQGSGGAFSGGYALYLFNEQGDALVKGTSVTYDGSPTSALVYTDEETQETYSEDEIKELFHSGQVLDLSNLSWTKVIQAEGANEVASSETDEKATSTEPPSQASHPKLEAMTIGETISFPEELVGTWTATEDFGMFRARSIEFSSDGSYKVYFDNTENSGKVISITKVAEGTYQFDEGVQVFALTGIGGSAPNLVVGTGFTLTDGQLIPQHWAGDGSLDYSKLDTQSVYTK